MANYIGLEKFDSLISMVSYFRDNKTCKDFLVSQRWSDGDYICPYCGHHHCYRRADGNFRCPNCLKNFSVLVGTIFENTKISLVKWFMAMYLVSSHKKGISSHQLARDLSVTQKTAWYILQKIRKLYGQDDANVFVGEVECDEVYIGGKEKWKHQSMRTPNTQGRSTKTKTPVFGMMERSEIENSKGEIEFMSYVHAMVVGNTKKDTLMPIISQFVEEGATVFTDELNAYNTLGSIGYNHKVCDHGQLQFVVDGEVYTNNIEGFWSHFRRMISGCYHDVSDEHLQSYIDEAVYRWNTRKVSQSERFSDMFNKTIGLIVTWDELRLCKAS